MRPESGPEVSGALRRWQVLPHRSVYIDARLCLGAIMPMYRMRPKSYVESLTPTCRHERLGAGTPDTRVCVHRRQTSLGGRL